MTEHSLIVVRNLLSWPPNAAGAGRLSGRAAWSLGTGHRSAGTPARRTWASHPSGPPEPAHVAPQQPPRACMNETGKTVLLVEDNEDNRIVYSTILRHFGYRVTEALNGEEGIAKA